MARQEGVIKIKGTLDDLTFYQSQDGNLIRRKGSLDANRISNDPGFLRTRENNSEFANAAEAGKLVRDTVRSMMIDAADSRVISRLLKQMTLVKNLDATSGRGKRNVAVAIALPAAQDLLKNFNFNNRGVLNSVFFSPFTVNTVDGTIDIKGFIPADDVLFPEGATHVSLESGFARVDFTNGKGELQVSPVTNLPIDETSTDVSLKPSAVPSVTGTSFYLLKLSFFQMINTVQYSLRNGAFNSLAIVQVA